MDPYAWTFGSYTITQAGQTVAMIANLDGTPDRKGANVTIPDMAGRQHIGKPYDQRIITVPVLITAATRAALQSALDALSAALAIPGRQTLARGMADGSGREILAEVANAIAYKTESDLAARFVIEFLAASPYWQAQTPTAETETGIGSSPHNYNVSYTGTAAHETPTITIRGTITNPKLAAGDYWIQYTGSVTPGGGDLVINCETFTATYNGADVTAAITHGGGLAWFVLSPGTNALTLTGSGLAAVEVDLDYTALYL